MNRRRRHQMLLWKAGQTEHMSSAFQKPVVLEWRITLVCPHSCDLSPYNCALPPILVPHSEECSLLSLDTFSHAHLVQPLRQNQSCFPPRGPFLEPCLMSASAFSRRGDLEKGWGSTPRWITCETLCRNEVFGWLDIMTRIHRGIKRSRDVIWSSYEILSNPSLPQHSRHVSAWSDSSITFKLLELLHQWIILQLPYSEDSEGCMQVAGAAKEPTPCS